MSRRRSSHGQDSLELLLDTICNTFGGVLFIAMLVILLLQQTRKGPDAPIPPAASPVELQSLAIRLESVAAELARLKENRQSQQSIVDGFAPAAIRDQLEQRRRLTNQQDALQAEVDKAMAKNAQLASQVESIARDNDSVPGNLEEAVVRRDRAQSELDQVRQSHVQEIRMPVVRSAAGKQEIGLILRYGRLYVWHKYGPGYRRLGLNTDDFVIIGETGDGIHIRPKPTRGVLLEKTAESQAAIRAVLSRFDKRSCVLAVVARPDSYGHFRYVRDIAIELGLEYRLMPTGESNPIADRGGTGGRVQ